MKYEDPQDIQKYIWCMKEIKFRMDVIINFIDGKKSTGQLPIDMEFVALQFRKVLELIVLASISANKKSYSQSREYFYSDWYGKRILEDLGNVNPKFYPEPGKQISDDRTGRVIRIEEISEEYLTKELFVKLYDRSSELLHSFNPYSPYPDSKKIMREEFPKWKDWIINLLNHHQIQLVNSDKQLWVVMRSKGDNDVHVFEMQRTDSLTK